MQEPKCFEVSIRGTVIAIQCGWQHFVKGCILVLIPVPPVISVSHSSVWLLCRSHTVISVVHFGEKETDRLKNAKNYQCTKIHAEHGEHLNSYLNRNMDS